MKKYRLKKRHPSLPEDWLEGMEVKKIDSNYISKTYDGGYMPISACFNCKYLTKKEVENNPYYWEEIKEKEMNSRK